MRIPLSYIALFILTIVTLFLANGQYKKIALEADRQVKIAEKRQLREFKVHSAKLTDPVFATKRGISYINAKQSERACMVLERAAQLDANYRDSSLYLGYAYLKDIGMRKNELTEKQKKVAVEKAKKTLLNAQKIDPLHPLTNQLLAIIAQMQNNDKEKSLWYARYETVSLKNLANTTQAKQN